MRLDWVSLDSRTPEEGWACWTSKACSATGILRQRGVQRRRVRIIGVDCCDRFQVVSFSGMVAGQWKPTTSPRRAVSVARALALAPARRCCPQSEGRSRNIVILGRDHAGIRPDELCRQVLFRPSVRRPLTNNEVYGQPTPCCFTRVRAGRVLWLEFNVIVVCAPWAPHFASPNPMTDTGRICKLQSWVAITRLRLWNC